MLDATTNRQWLEHQHAGDDGIVPGCEAGSGA
jgi:hypothetical protein